MTPQEAEGVIRRMFAAFTDFATPIEQFATFLVPGYVQKVDGKTLNIHQFCEHVLALRATLRNLTITIEEFVSDGTKAATVHVAEGTKRSGERVRAKVVAFYKFENDRIALIDELTSITHGAESDRTLGSTIAGLAGPVAG